MNRVHHELSRIGTQHLNSFNVLGQDALNAVERLVELTCTAARELLHDTSVQIHDLGSTGSLWTPLSGPILHPASLEKASTYFQRYCAIVVDNQGRFMATLQAGLAEFNGNANDIATASLRPFVNLAESGTTIEAASPAPARSRKGS